MVLTDTKTLQHGKSGETKMNKSLIFNVLSIVTLIVNQNTGTFIPAEYAALALAAINAAIHLLKRTTK